MIRKKITESLPRVFLFFLIVPVVISCEVKKPTVPEYPGPDNRKSPVVIAAINENGTYIKVVYGQPYRRGRTIFGEWELYGEVWRTGANEATEITFTNPVLLNNEMVEAGTYALFTIPYEDHWTVILNNALGRWGAFDYNPALDYRRFDVPVTVLTRPVETFSISFSEPKNKATTMILTWDLVQVDIPIVFY